MIVEHAKFSVPVHNCPLSAYGCQRLRWATTDCARPDSGSPVIDVVLQKNIRAVLCVELDWADSVERLAFDVIPLSVPMSAEEVRRRNRFTNAFAREHIGGGEGGCRKGRQEKASQTELEHVIVVQMIITLDHGLRLDCDRLNIRPGVRAAAARLWRQQPRFPAAAMDTSRVLTGHPRPPPPYRRCLAAAPPCRAALPCRALPCARQGGISGNESASTHCINPGTPSPRPRPDQTASERALKMEPMSLLPTAAVAGGSPARSASRECERALKSAQL